MFQLNNNGDSMLVAFGTKRCPFCGDFGKEVSKSTFHCSRCEIVFDNFSVSEVREFDEKMWN